MLASNMPETTLLRLRTQLDTIPLLLDGADPAAAERRPAPEKWSARENLAHLGRYHEVTLERLRHIREETDPPLARYRAEDDPAWERWSALALPTVLADLAAQRAALLAEVTALSATALARRGVHPLLGPMTVPLLLEFFLLHEAHHLYVAMPLLRSRTPSSVPLSNSAAPRD